MSIFARLFLILIVLSAVPLVAVAVVLSGSSRDVAARLQAENGKMGAVVAARGGKILREGIESTHLKIIRDKATRLEAFLGTIRRAVRLESLLASQFLGDSDPGDDAPPLWEGREMARRAATHPAFLADVVGVAPYAIYHASPGADPARVAGATARLRRLGRFFAHTFQTVPGCVSPYLGHRDGFILGYPGRQEFPESYDPRTRPWYTEAIARRHAIWTDVAFDKNQTELLVTCAEPIWVDGEADPVGVAALDVRLTDVVRELFDLGNVEVAEAILIDDRGRVRVGADYRGRSFELDKQAILEMPAVDDLKDRGFSDVARRVASDRGAEVGTYWDEPTTTGGAESGHLYLFAAVHPLPTDDGRAGASRVPVVAPARWCYAVKLPLGPILRPLGEVRSSIEGATRAVGASIRDETREAGEAMLTITAIAVLASLVLALVAARAITRPLLEMARVAGEIGEGRFDRHVAATSRDEIGQLGRAINGMIEGLKERDFVKGTFRRYVSAAVVDRLLIDRHVAIGGVRRELTIFFSDLKNFTGLAESLAPEALVEVLNEYLGAMTDTILESEGTVDKYIGDAVLAFWGDPVAHDDDAARACLSALRQRRVLDDLRARWADRGLPPLEMRIGIETGPVIVGNVGSSLQMNYTVLGDTVNLASRLEGANKFYGTGILIGEQTHRAAAGAIEAREIDLLAVKGKRRAVRVYELLGEAGRVAPDRIEAARTYEAALAAYRLRDWDAAEAGFRRARDLLGGDRASDVLLDRVASYRVAARPDDWDGSFALSEK